MKVASISHLFPNSVNPNNGVFVKERLKHVAEKIDITVIAPVPAFPFIGHTSKYAGIGKVPTEEIIDGLMVYHPRYFMIPKYFKCFDAMFYATSMASFMEKMISEHQYDLLDFHWVYPDAIGGLNWARRFGKKAVVTVRGNEAIYYYEKTLLREVVRKRLSEFDHVVVVSNDLKNKILSEYNIESSRVTVIANGIDREKFYRTEKVAALRHCGLDGEKRYILSVSRLSREKGLENLLRAFAKMACRETELLIIGDGPLKGELVSLCSDAGISNRVRFLGNIGHSETCHWYNAADVFCLSSLWEGCPNVVIEALACGTPVVATRVGGIPDLVPGDDYGTLAPPGDIDSLAGALEKALRKDWDRRAICEFGSANSWQDVADKVINVFKEVLS